MADTIKWLFEMIDKVSGPSKTASSSLSTFIQTTHSALAATQLLGQAAMGAGRLIAAGLQPAISKEKSLGAFETLLGTAEKARDMYGQAVKFAAETPFETADVVDSFQRLLTARFAQEEVPIAMRIIGDAASMQEDSKQAVASVTRALSQIRSKGRLQGEELMQLQEAVPLNTAQLYERLGVIYGTNADAARKMQEAGQIDSQVASFAILAQLQEQFGGNMEKSSKQIGGLLSTLQSRPSELLSQLQDTSGYKRLSESLTDVITKFSDASPAGQMLQRVVNDLGSGILERVADGLTKAADASIAFADGFETGFGQLNDTLNATDEEKAKRFAENMRDIGGAAGIVSRTILAVASAISTVYDGFYRFGQWVGDHPWIQRIMFGASEEIIGAMTDIGAQGTVAGTTQSRLVAQRNMERYGVAVGHSLTSEEYSQYRSLAGLGRGLEAQGFLERLGTTSPLNSDALSEDIQRELLQRQGVYENLDIPEFAEGAIVNGRTLAYVGEAGPEVIAPIERGAISPLPGAMGGVNLSVSVMVNGGGSAAESLGQDIGYRVRVEMMSLLEQAGLQSGRLRTS